MYVIQGLPPPLIIYLLCLCNGMHIVLCSTCEQPLQPFCGPCYFYESKESGPNLILNIFCATISHVQKVGNKCCVSQVKINFPENV